MFKKLAMWMKKKTFLKTLNDEWFAYQAVNRDEGKEQLPVYFDENGKYVYIVDSQGPIYGGYSLYRIPWTDKYLHD